MCGVAGALAGANGRAAPEWVRTLCALQHNRGPDDSGFWTCNVAKSGSAVLGHSRLCVMDPSFAGHQPMMSPNGKVAITYNGEIYNHRILRADLVAAGWHFRSRSDTEVLLAAYCTWGDSAWDRLDGMFALAVVDQGRDQLLLVRSRLGSKPLAYARTDDGWLFASTADALALALDRSVNPIALAHGLATWAYDGEGAPELFQGIRTVEPGTVARWSMGERMNEPRVERWYDLQDSVRAIALPGSFQDAVRTVRDRLALSVEARLNADVPLGMSLSGGLDSTSIASLAIGAGQRPLDGYSYRTGALDSDAADLAVLAQSMGSRLRVHWVEAPAAGGVGDALESAMLCQGAPFGGFSVVAQHLVYRAARANGTVVMLGGQGADEVFMGYRKYLLAAARQARSEGHPFAAARYTGGLARSLWADRGDVRGLAAAALRYRSGSGFGASVFGDAPRAAVPLADPSSLSYADITWLSLPTLLRFEDRNSMAASIESRMPFLEHRLLAYALAVPTEFKVRHGYGKWILRKAMEPILPRRIVWQKAKRGFLADEAGWIRLGAGRWLRERIFDSLPLLVAAGAHREVVCERDRYADRALRQSPQRVHEALSLAWLATWEDARRPSDRLSQGR